MAGRHRGKGSDDRLALGRTRGTVRFPVSPPRAALPADYASAFAEAWPDRAVVQEPLARVPWYGHIALLEKLDGWQVPFEVRDQRFIVEAATRDAETAVNLKELGSWKAGS